MNSNIAIDVINELKIYASTHKLGLILVGSVGYRNALDHPDRFQFCDDLDCIFVYSKISDLGDLPYMNTSLFTAAMTAVGRHCDMFSTKNIVKGIKVSFDFISLSYLYGISKELLDGENKYRLKLTDAIEVSDHIYCDWYGNQILFHKEQLQYGNFRIYKLPIHLYPNHVFVPGVLLTKYLYNPTTILSIEGQSDYLRCIQRNVADKCPPGGSMYNFFYKRSDFSEETKQFLLNSVNTDVNLYTTSE